MWYSSSSSGSAPSTTDHSSSYLAVPVGHSSRRAHRPASRSPPSPATRWVSATWASGARERSAPIRSPARMSCNGARRCASASATARRTRRATSRAVTRGGSVRRSGSVSTNIPISAPPPGSRAEAGIATTRSRSPVTAASPTAYAASQVMNGLSRSCPATARSAASARGANTARCTAPPVPSTAGRSRSAGSAIPCGAPASWRRQYASAAGPSTTAPPDGTTGGAPGAPAPSAPAQRRPSSSSSSVSEAPSHTRWCTVSSSTSPAAPRSTTSARSNGGVASSNGSRTSRSSSAPSSASETPGAATQRHGTRTRAGSASTASPGAAKPRRSAGCAAASPSSAARSPATSSRPANRYTAPTWYRAVPGHSCSDAHSRSSAAVSGRPVRAAPPSPASAATSRPNSGYS